MDNIKYDIVNLSNSILKKFNVPTFHETIPSLDEAIKSSNKVVLILLDAFGKNIIEKHLDESSFIRKHFFETIKATYPPTTVASTNGMLSARYPIENGWMGWSQYFNKYEQCVDVFRDENTATRIKLPNGASPINEFCSYKNIVTLINECNKKEIAKMVMPSFAMEGGATSTKHFFKLINERIKDEDTKFMYCYYTEPDATMHIKGIEHKSVHKLILKLDKYIKDLVTSNKDVTFITIADHGMINHVHIDLDKYPKIIECLERPGSLEKRTVSLKVKDEYIPNFKEIFNKSLGGFAKFFDIYTIEEALDMELFGKGELHPLAKEFIGNFVVCANDVFSLYQTSMMQSDEIFLTAHHAGKTPDERLINIGVYNK